MRSMPWGNVFEWLTDQTGLPVVTNHKPTGSFDFYSPKVKYTLPQVLDLMNEALLIQKYILIRREASFVLVPADEKIDPILVPRIGLDDLDQRGKTEIVSVILPLQTMNVEDTAPEIKKLM